MKKYTAILTAWNGLEWNHDTIEIQVDSLAEAQKWIDEHNLPYVDYTLNELQEN
jgi:hypothetical protein